MSVWFKDQLNGPNGLFWEPGRLLVASQGGQDFASIDPGSGLRQVLTGNIGRGDGIVWTGIPGYYIVSDWEGEIFMIGPDNNAVSLLRTKDKGYNTADIEYVPSMNLLLVPTFFNNSVVAYKLSEVKN
ncbi:MAG: hypothetical protein GYA41_03845 [Bacteroidales bacterium]|nr:hypothetical protein [Bacteroidales bacterium]